MKQKTMDTRYMASLAMLCGLLLVMGMTGIGFIPLPVIKATTMHIPVILGSILLGPKKGAVLGGIFGLTSFINNTMNPTVTSFVFTPFYTMGEIHGGIGSIVICFLPRILVGEFPFFISL